MRPSLEQKYEELQEKFPQPYFFRCENCGQPVVRGVHVKRQSGFISVYRPKYCFNCDHDDLEQPSQFFHTTRLFQIY